MVSRARSRPLVSVVAVLAAIRLVVNTAQRFVYPFLPAIARGLGISLERAGILVSARWFAGLATPVAVGWVGRGERRVRLAVFGMSLFAVGAALTEERQATANARQPVSDVRATRHKSL